MLVEIISTRKRKEEGNLMMHKRIEWAVNTCFNVDALSLGSARVRKISFIKTRLTFSVLVNRQRAFPCFSCEKFSHGIFSLLTQFPSLSLSLVAGNEDNTKNHKQEPKLNFLIKAIYTMAYGLQAYHDDVCGKDFIGVCPQLAKSFNHSKFFVSQSSRFFLIFWTFHNRFLLFPQNFLMNVSFTTEEKENVEFNQDGDVTAHYDIMNFQQMPDGSFAYVQIGDWDNHSLEIYGDFKPPSNGSLKFSSVCSKACSPGFYKVIKSIHCTIDW